LTLRHRRARSVIKALLVYLAACFLLPANVPISSIHVRDHHRASSRSRRRATFAIAIDYPRDDFRVQRARRLVSRSRYQFPFRVSIRHGRAFPSACRISQGNGNRFEERRCETALGNTPSACLRRHRVIPLVSHSGGSSPRALLSPSRSFKRALVRVHREISLTRYSRRCFPIFSLLSSFHQRVRDRDSAIKARVEEELSDVVSETEDSWCLKN